MRDMVTDNPIETVHIPIFDMAPYEAAARLFAVLAYPKVTEKKPRARFERAICFKAIEGLCNDPNWANSNQSIRPSDLLQDRKAVEIEYKRGVAKIKQERMIAAKVAAPTDCYLVASADGVVGIAGADITAQELGYFAPTSNERIAEVSLDLDEIRVKKNAADRRLRPRGRRRIPRRVRLAEANNENIKHRCWSSSKPVLHLCLALQMTLNEGREMDYLDLSIEDFFNNPGLIMTTIESAATYRNVVPHEYNKILKNGLVHITWR
jgi:hypothetical protein